MTQQVYSSPNSAHKQSPMIYLINFETGIDISPSAIIYAFNAGGSDGDYPTNEASFTRYVSGDPAGPYGAIEALTGNYYGACTATSAIAGSGASATSAICNIQCGSPPLSNNEDIVGPNGSFYNGPFTQSYTIYIPVTGPYAWQVPPDSLNGCFIFNINPNNATDTYEWEVNLFFGVPSAGTLITWLSLDSTYAGLPGGNVGFATITKNGWYTATITYFRDGDLVTDGGCAIVSIYNSDNKLLGSELRPGQPGLEQGNAGYPPGTPCSLMMGANNNEIWQWQTGWNNQVLLFDNACAYFGYPNPTQCPRILNRGYLLSGIVSSNFSFVITATNSPTSFGVIGLPSGILSK